MHPPRESDVREARHAIITPTDHLSRNAPIPLTVAKITFPSVPATDGDVHVHVVTQGKR